MASQNTKPTLLRNIKPFGVYFKIKVRVGRIWRPRAYNSDAFDGLHYLLIDETGDTIEGIIEEDYYQNMTKTMEEGKIYEITKFHNKRYTATTKLVNHEVQLLFNRFTQFIEVDETMSPPPRYGFHLLQYNEFTAQLHKQKVLADLYGCMKTISTEYEVSLDAKNKTVREIVLTNLRREEIKVSLWGDPAKNLDADAIEQMPQPVFAVITSLRVTKYQDEIIGSGAEHTCIIINPQIDEEQEYKAEFSKPGDRVRIIKKGTHKPPSEKNIKTVAELYQLDPQAYMNDTIYCKASITGYPIHNGWWYKGCSSPNCNKLLKHRQDGDTFVCDQHGVQKPIPCYRVNMTIEDATNEATVTLMGKEAEKLFGTTCEQLVNKRPPDAQQTLPKDIENTIGQCYLFEIKFSKYGQRTVKRILSDHQIPKSPREQQLMTATPQKTSERKRGMEPSAEPKKKLEREISEPTSSKNQNQKQKIN